MIRTGTTPEGLRYAVRHSASAVAYCALHIRCGTRDEAGFPEGIAHFTEHTVFRGTARKSARTINSCLDRLGGELNAYTTKEETVFHATVLKEDLPKAAALLMELATEATFPDEEIATEKGVVIDEIVSAKDSPAEDIYDRFEELLLAGHPLGRSILGTARSVRRITPDDLRRFTGARFIPGRMAFTVVADLDEDRMERDILRLCRKHFTVRIPDTPTTAYAPPTPVRFDRTVDKRNHEANAILGGPAPSLYDERDRIPTVLLANILGGPASNSLLNNLLRERNGWVYAVECSYAPYADTGVIAISFGCEKVLLEKCFTLLERQLARLRDIPLTDRQLKAAQRQLLGQLAISADNGETQCLSMGKSLLAYGRIAPTEETRQRLAAVTAADLHDLAGRLFDPARLSRLIFL